MRARLLRELSLAPGEHPRGLGHLSAASGLARVGRRLYVAADDEHHLGVLELEADAPVRLLRIAEGDLPSDAAERKRRKRDFEAVCALPASGAFPHGALLVLGSASRPNREHALALPLDARGAPAGQARALPATALLAPLRPRFADLNIEGAFVLEGSMCLLQRGHLADPRSACIRFRLDAFTAWLTGRSGVPPAPARIHEYELDRASGVPLTFTDGEPAPGGGWWFSAVAESTGDSYLDGRCVASAIGRVDAAGRLAWMDLLEGAPKVEGLALDGERLLMVTDADDPQVPSRLLEAALPAA